jgi:hypothetical protein
VSSSVQFPAEAVLRHADAVRDASDQMGRARAAAGEVAMSSDAYGQLCQFLPTLLSPVFGIAVGVMNDAVEALGETALNLSKTTADMTTTDAGNARRLNSAGGPGLDLPL